MRNNIIKLLNEHPDLPTGEIVSNIGKRGSVSKMLSRMVAAKQITRTERDGLFRYSLSPSGHIQNIAKEASSIASSGAIGG